MAAQTEMVTREGNLELDLQGQHWLSGVYGTKVVSTRTKLRLFNSGIMSTLVCACEGWKPTKGTDSKLDSLENKCLGRVLGIKCNEFRGSAGIE